MEKSLEEKLMDLKMRKKGSSVPTPCLAPSGAGDTAQRLVSLPLAGSRIQAGRAEQGAFLLVSKWLKIQGIPLHLLPALSWDQSPPGQVQLARMFPWQMPPALAKPQPRPAGQLLALLEPFWGGGKVFQQLRSFRVSSQEVEGPNEAPGVGPVPFSQETGRGRAVASAPGDGRATHGWRSGPWLWFLLFFCSQWPQVGGG